MKLKFVFIAISLLLTQLSIAAPLACTGNATPQTTIIDFFDVGDGFSCPNKLASCVDDWQCPHLEHLQCPAGSLAYKITVGYAMDGATQNSCPIEEEACVKAELCPVLAQMFCAKGDAQMVTVGFEKIEGTPYSCPRYSGGCVDENKCPQY